MRDRIIQAEVDFELEIEIGSQMDWVCLNQTKQEWYKKHFQPGLSKDKR